MLITKLFFVLCAVLSARQCSGSIAIENDYPTIGVLTQEISYSLKKKYPDQYHSYLAASYVKFVEGGGAKVAPIWIGKPREYYEDLMSKINGVLFPGGATFFNQSAGYAEAGAHIFEVAKQMNDRGKYMPIWGTCLGFELLTYLSANATEHRSHCRSSNQALPLEFKDGFRQSRLFRSAPTGVIRILSSESVTANFHQFCVTERNLTEFGLDTEWKVLSVNHDWDGFEFISSIEHFKYPFYGVQFHPEKNIYEWVKNKNISHTRNAIKTAQYFADFFVNEARKSSNKFPDKSDELNSLIYNYSPKFTAKKGSSFLQAYMFEDAEVSDSGSTSLYAFFCTTLLLISCCLIHF